MNHVEVIEGLGEAIGALLEKVTLCEFYANMYTGVSTANRLQLQKMLDSALPELYAAIIVFAAKARNYFEAKGTYTSHL